MLFLQKKLRRTLLCMLLTITLGWLFTASAQAELSLHSLPLEANGQTITPQDLSRLEKVMAYIKLYYYKPTKEKDLVSKAIGGMLSQLDPHSSYLEADDLKDLETLTAGKFGGIGVEVLPQDGVLKVVSPLDDTPAAAAGIKPGDLIVQINNKFIKDMEAKDAIKMMRGPKGSKLTLVILRKNSIKPLTLNLIRDDIKLKTVKSKTLEPDFGYLRVAFFQEPTAKDMEKAINTLLKENHTLKGLVLDLRNNPGGLLDSSIQVADDFLDADKLKNNHLIVYTKGQFDGSQIYAKATSGELLPGVPMVVLINEGSASAAEIVAGALQDHKRAIILGTRSFGKGSVQTLLPIDDTTAIKLTTALYYTPLGRSIQAKGIEPDVLVNDLKIPKLKAETLDEGRIDESNLADHIETDKNGDATESDSENNEINEEATKDARITKEARHKIENDELTLAHNDYQLYQALMLLKGLNVLPTAN